jgi:hypothetical protein
VDPRTVLDSVVKRKIPNPSPGIDPYNPDRPSRSLVAIPTELSRGGGGGGGVLLQLTKLVSQLLVLVPSPFWDL